MHGAFSKKNGEGGGGGGGGGQMIPFIFLYSFPRDHTFPQSHNIDYEKYLDCLNLLFSKYSFLSFNFSG